MERTTYTARTKLGVPIATFAERSMAITWAEMEGDRFDGWFITRDTEVTITRSVPIRRDPKSRRAAA